MTAMNTSQPEPEGHASSNSSLNREALLGDAEIRDIPRVPDKSASDSSSALFAEPATLLAPPPPDVSRQEPRVVISADRMTAWLTLAAGCSGAELAAVLQAAGVIYGINQTQLARLSAENKPVERQEIAHGRPSRTGIDAHIGSAAQ